MIQTVGVTGAWGAGGSGGGVAGLPSPERGAEELEEGDVELPVHEGLEVEAVPAGRGWAGGGPERPADPSRPGCDPLPPVNRK